MSDSQRPISWTPARPLTDEQVLEMFDGSPPDAYSVLSRRGRKPLSDDSVARMLVEAAPVPASTPIPTAERVTLPPRRLEYATARRTREVSITTVPVVYRVVRIGMWLGVAAAMVAVMAGSIRGR